MQKGENDIQFHIKCGKGDIGKYCILPGDPGRCKPISEFFDEPNFVASNREYTVYTGTLEGEKISVCSTGIGGPSAAIAMEELANLGTKYFIRIGSCGGIDLNVKAGDIIVAQSAVRQDGTSYEYAPEGYPATADFDITAALVSAAKKNNASLHIGVVQSKDSFYGQHSPERMPQNKALSEKWEAYKKLGVLASEMESATLFTVAAARKVKCGALFLVLWNQEREKSGLDQDEFFDMGISIKCVIDAFREIIKNERK